MIGSVTYYDRCIADKDHTTTNDTLNEKYVNIIQDRMQKSLLILYVGTKQPKMVGHNGV